MAIDSVYIRGCGLNYIDVPEPTESQIDLPSQILVSACLIVEFDGDMCVW